jgi:hypothetical protein
MKVVFKDKLFNEFYKNNRSQFVENLILWSVVFNPECPEAIYKKILKEKIKEDDKEAFTNNYIGSRTTDYKLLKVTETNLNKLGKAFYELDGTLLSDIVGNYMETHKIF